MAEKKEVDGAETCCGCLLMVLMIVAVFWAVSQAGTATEGAVYFVVNPAEPKLCGGAFYAYDLAVSEAYALGSPWTIKRVKRSQWKKSHYLCMRKYNLTPPSFSL